MQIIDKNDWFSIYPYRLNREKLYELKKDGIRHYWHGFTNTDDIIKKFRQDIIADYIVVTNDDKGWSTYYMWDKSAKNYIETKELKMIG